MSKGTLEAWICDVCGYRWALDSRHGVPVQCRNSECRTRSWNKGVKAGAELAVAELASGAGAREEVGNADGKAADVQGGGIPADRLPGAQGGGGASFAGGRVSGRGMGRKKRGGGGAGDEDDNRDNVCDAEMSIGAGVGARQCRNPDCAQPLTQLRGKWVCEDTGCGLCGQEQKV